LERRKRELEIQFNEDWQREFGAGHSATPEDFDFHDRLRRAQQPRITDQRQIVPLTPGPRMPIAPSSSPAPQLRNNLTHDFDDYYGD
jgi:hypothetical protein